MKEVATLAGNGKNGSEIINVPGNDNSWFVSTKVLLYSETHLIGAFFMYDFEDWLQLIV